MSETLQERLSVIFQREVEEGIETLRSGLCCLKKNLQQETSPALVAFLHLHAHSLKGASRSVNRSDIHLLVQSMEGLLAGWIRGSAAPSAPALGILSQALDLLEELITGPAADAPGRVAEMSARIVQLR